MRYDIEYNRQIQQYQMTVSRKKSAAITINTTISDHATAMSPSFKLQYTNNSTSVPKTTHAKQGLKTLMFVKNKI